jgi:hypothetical protein
MARRATKVVARPRSVEQGPPSGDATAKRDAGARVAVCLALCAARSPAGPLGRPLRAPLRCRGAQRRQRRISRKPGGTGHSGRLGLLLGWPMRPGLSVRSSGAGRAHQAAIHDPNRLACGCSRTRPAATGSQPPRYRLRLASRHAAPERSPRPPSGDRAAQANTRVALVGTGAANVSLHCARVEAPRCATHPESRRRTRAGS